LKSSILDGLSSEANAKEETKYGKKYSVLVKICIFDKEANVLTAWIIDKGKDFPKLVSCYIKD
jgi:hypothetical protein